jgi:hypothetical protein
LPAIGLFRFSGDADRWLVDGTLCAVVALPLFGSLRRWSRRDYVLAAAGAAVWANLSETVVWLVVLASIRALIRLRDARRDALLPLLTAVGGAMLSPRAAEVITQLPIWIARLSRLGMPGWSTRVPVEFPRAGDGVPGLSFSLAPWSLLTLLALGLGLGSLGLAWRWRGTRLLASRGLYRSLILLAAGLLSLWNEIFEIGLLFAIVYGVELIALRPRRLHVTAALPGWGYALAALALAIPLGLSRAWESRQFGRVPAKAARFIEEAGLEGSIAADPRWGGYLVYQTGNRPAPSSPDGEPDLLVIPVDGPVSGRVLRAFLPVYANSLVGILLNRNQRNATNLARVKSYYSSRGLPFDARAGFDLDAISKRAPAWPRQNEERPALGPYPAEWVIAGETLERSAYYRVRDLRASALAVVEEGLAVIPDNWQLQVERISLLLAANDLAGARFAIGALEARPAPEWALTRIREFRWALLRAERGFPPHFALN